MFLLPVKIREDVVKGAGCAGFFLAFRRPVSFAQIPRPYQWVVNETLQHHGHEARLSHIVQASESRSTAGRRNRVCRNELPVLAL